MRSSSDEFFVYGGRFQARGMFYEESSKSSFWGMDLLDESKVVIKIIPVKIVGSRLYKRLEHAFSVLKLARSPWLTPPIDLQHHGNILYLVRPFRRGKPLNSRLQQGTISLREAITLGQCLFMGLQEAHDHGVLHGNIKPTNVIVDEVSPHASLTDFGLSPIDVISDRSQLSVQEVQYLSPEQAGLVDMPVGQWSDLYSVGILLYEIICGHPPFQAESTTELLRQLVSSEVPTLRSLGFSVPKAFDEVIQRLLRKDASERYQSAIAVLFDLSKIAGGLDRGEQDPSMVVGLRDQHITVTEPVFIGRSEELRRLEKVFEQTKAGRGGVVLLESESGVGKTRLLDEVSERFVSRGAWILRGRAVSVDVPHPFFLFDGVVDDFVSRLHSDVEFATIANHRLMEKRDALCAALPRLRPILGGDVPQNQEETSNVLALPTFFDSLGSSKRPAIILLDDCQEGDELTFKVISNWQRSNAFDGRFTSIVLSFRSEDVPEDHILRKLEATVSLELGKLGQYEIEELLISMAGPLPMEAIEVVERISQGNPFMASAVLRGLVETGALINGRSGWEVASQARFDVQASRQAAAFLEHRLKLLPERTLNLLSAGAVLGKVFDFELATELAKLTPKESQLALEIAYQRHIVWTKPGMNSSRYEFVHDKLREACLHLLTHEERRELHLESACLLEKQDNTLFFELAYHFFAGGSYRQALPYAVEAAERAIALR